MNKYKLAINDTRTAFYEIEADSEERAIEEFDERWYGPVSAQDYHNNIKTLSFKSKKIERRVIEDKT